MINPLFKKIHRDFKKGIGKYLILFAFVLILVSLVSGYIIGNNSMIKSYYANMENYRVEDGNFQATFIINDSILQKIEEENDIKVYYLPYVSKKINNDHDLRIYNISDRQNNNVDLFDVMKGRIPSNDYEIALDRLYCENNGIEVGDYITIDNKQYLVTSYVSLIDYQTLFKNNADTMFQSSTFSIALVNDSTFSLFGPTNLTQNYVYRYNNRNLTDKEINQKEQDITKYIYVNLLSSGNHLENIVVKSNNQSINFSIEDIKGDLATLELLCLLIGLGVLLVFSLSIKNDIVNDSKAIGTLKALGYHNSDILFHYLILPTLTTFLSAIIGNILAYTVMKDYFVSLYYHSYSLMSYTTYYSAKALIVTTIIPLASIFIMNVIIIMHYLRVPILNFLHSRVELKGKKKVKQLSNKIKFTSRFRLRVAFSNIGTFISLIIGSLVACLILLFGLILMPTLNHYKDRVVESQIAPYQTILKSDVETNIPAEKYLVVTLQYDEDEITVYGLFKTNDSSFLKDINIEPNKAVINSTLYEKYLLKRNDTIELYQKYSNDSYKLDISGVYNNESTLTIFIDSNTFIETFGTLRYLYGYWSNEPLSDVSDDFIYKVITTKDVYGFADQLIDSFGRIVHIYVVAVIILFALLILMLSKTVMEKNTLQISMLKILGYNQSEISTIYTLTIGIMVLISVLVATPISGLLLSKLWWVVMGSRMKGYIPVYIPIWIYFVVFGALVGSFILSFLIEKIKIKKIPLSIALKNQE